MKRTLSTMLVALAAASIAGAGAQTLYKLIDKNGKVTYTETPPKNFEGQVVPLNIDPKANTATLPKASAPDAAAAATAAASDEQLRAARQKVETARKALAEARENPGEGDIARVGKKGGGTRPQESEDFRKRLDKLEREVKEAEDELRKVERAR